MNTTSSSTTAFAPPLARVGAAGIVEALPNQSGHEAGAASALPERTSATLRRLLSDHPDVESFTVERILATLGAERREASLLTFTLPAIVPVPSPTGMVEVPTGALGLELAIGGQRVRLPRFILAKSVSRRALAVAIHATLPAIEAAEKVMRPRWSWATQPAARRAVGVFVFLLAMAIAQRVLGFTALHATSISLMSLGMAEQDGLAVMMGAGVGVLSLAIVAASGMAGGGLRAKAGKWARGLARKLGLRALAAILAGRGYHRLAALLTLQWSDLLLLWEPERRRARRTQAKTFVWPRARRRAPRVDLHAERASRAA